MNTTLNKIDSFKVSHTTLEKGLYVSRTDNVNGEEVVTYDIRVVKPNCGDYMEPAAVHTCEHIIASYVRSVCDNIIYFGPMGCLTGFYLIVHHMSHEEVKELLIGAFRTVADYKGKIIGATAEECGNYKFHDLIGAKQIAESYLIVLNQLNSFNYV